MSTDALDIARWRIASEAKERSGSLDLSRLELSLLPEELIELPHLRRLNCSDTAVNDLTHLSSLENLTCLDCAGTKVEDLRPLAGLKGLLHLNIWHTPVNDLRPICDLLALESLNFGWSLVGDLLPLTGLTALKTLVFSAGAIKDITALGGLFALERLECNHTPVRNLTPLKHLTELRYFDCSYTPVIDLMPLSGLTKLEALKCSVLGLRSLEPLAALKALRTLDCSATDITELAPLATLASLTHLNCSITSVSDLRPLANLTTLESLDCGETKVDTLTPLSRLRNLRYFDCHWTGVSDLRAIKHLTNLQHFDCTGTKVSDLSPLAELQNLLHLNVGASNINDLTPLKHLVSLEHLDCNHTFVDDLAALERLETLRHLDFGSTKVNHLDSLEELPRVEYIDCHGTTVSDLRPLTNLAGLRHLDCSATGVTDLAPLATLSALQHLNVSKCSLRALPKFVYCLSSLRLLAFDTKVPSMPYGVLSLEPDEDCRLRVIAHFADQAEGVQEVKEVKVLLLGNGGVGKTQIARWLLGERFDSAWNSTHGIQITAAARHGSIAALLNLRIWDFGGQDIYHGTHALFLRGPAVVMPIWSQDQEQREKYEYEGQSFRNFPLEYWIDVVRHQSGTSNPVLITQNKCDRVEQIQWHLPVSLELIKSLPSVVQLHISAKERHGSGTLKDALQNAIGWLHDASSLGVPKIGQGRLRVKQRLEAMREADLLLPPAQRRHRLIERKDFDAICASEGGVENNDMLLTYLDANGSILYRPGVLTELIILDQDWALEAIYAVFDRKKAYSHFREIGGRISRRSLGLFVWQTHSVDEQDLLLKLMIACGMCFLHRQVDDADGRTEEYIVPDLLPAKESVANLEHSGFWLEEVPTQSISFHFELFHEVLIRAIMVSIGTISGPSAIYWRGGLCGYDHFTRSRLLIQVEMTAAWQGTIQVRAQGGRVGVLLAKAASLIGNLASRYGVTSRSQSSYLPPMSRSDAAEPISLSRDVSRVQEWYVSYAWPHKYSSAERTDDAIIDRLCNPILGPDRRLLYDKEMLTLSDRTLPLMERIGVADRVIAILNEKYLQSLHSMLELCEVWRTTRRSRDALPDRVSIYVLPSAKVETAADRAVWIDYWKRRHLAVEAMNNNDGSSRMGVNGNVRLFLMARLCQEIPNVFSDFAGTMQPRTPQQLELYGFNAIQH